MNGEKWANGVSEVFQTRPGQVIEKSGSQADSSRRDSRKCYVVRESRL